MQPQREMQRRLQDVTCSRAGEDDPGLDSWASKLLEQAENYVRNKQPDPLEGFLITFRR